MSVSSLPRPAAVAAVLATAPCWTHGRRKSDGRPFYIVPGSKPGVVYYVDATDCTCPDARQRGRTCKHSLAVADFERSQRQVAGAEHTATSSPTSWRPCSRGCGELLAPEHVGKMCDPCYERIARALEVIE